MRIFYKLNAASRMTYWSIEPEADGYIACHGLVGGASQSTFEHIPHGKSGRTVNQQIILQINSRIKRKLDQGFSETAEEALCPATNQLKLPSPMLAHRMDKSKVGLQDGALMQYKYDGHRCLIANVNGELKAYTRTGIPITSISHIISALQEVIPLGEVLDGELYIHGMPLQNIGSLVRREQADSALLTYVVYDIVNDSPYPDRLEILCNMIIRCEACIVLAPTLEADGLDLTTELTNAISNGYEGLIIRQGDKGYEVGKRSSSLLKVKKHMSSEFLIVDIEESKNGWAILVCETHEGKRFRCSAPGTIEEKTDMLINKLEYISLEYVTVNYFSITNNGIPFHPVAVEIRYGH